VTAIETKRRRDPTNNAGPNVFPEKPDRIKRCRRKSKHITRLNKKQSSIGEKSLTLLEGPKLRRRRGKGTKKVFVRAACNASEFGAAPDPARALTSNGNVAGASGGQEAGGGPSERQRTLRSRLPAKIGVQGKSCRGGGGGCVRSAAFNTTRSFVSVAARDLLYGGGGSKGKYSV